MGANGTNTWVEMRLRFMADIGQAKVLPDAPVDVLVSMETLLIQDARAPIDAMNANGTSDVPLPPGAGQPPPPPSMPMPMPGGPGGPGGMAGSQMAGMGIRGGMPMPPAHAQIQSALGLIGQGQ